MLDKSIRRAYRLITERKYDTPRIYWTIDLHDTCIKGTHTPNTYEWINDDVVEVLKFIKTFPESVIIIWTSCYPEEKTNIENFFLSHGVHYDFFNENPDAKDTKTGYFKEKFYSSVILDDKAGFDPETDWKIVMQTLKEIHEEDTNIH